MELITLHHVVGPMVCADIGVLQLMIIMYENLFGN